MPGSPAKRGKASRSRPAAPPLVELVLYISHQSRYAQLAQRNFEDLLTRIDRRNLRYEICDVGEHPERGDEDGVCYTPMLVKRHPLPRTSVVGDLSNTDALIQLLESNGVKRVR